MQLGQQSNPHSAVFPFSSFGAETGRHFRSAQGKAQDQTCAEMWKEYEWQFLPLLYIQYDSLYLLGFARFGSVTNLTNLPILKKNGSPPHPPAFPCSGSSAGCRRRRGPLRGSFDRSCAPRGQGPLRVDFGKPAQSCLPNSDAFRFSRGTQWYTWSFNYPKRDTYTRIPTWSIQWV